MKINAKKIKADHRVDDLHREYGFAGEDKWGWWCYLKEGWICSNGSSTINERTLSDIWDEVNNSVNQNTH